MIVSPEDPTARAKDGLIEGNNFSIDGDDNINIPAGKGVQSEVGDIQCNGRSGQCFG